jgi:MFS family permease
MSFQRIITNPSLTVVILEGFFARLGFGVITFALPFYALQLGMSYAEIGVLAALRLVAAIAFKPIMGAAADRFGKKRVYVWSIAGRAIVGVGLAFASTPAALYAVRILHGVTTAARDPVSAFLIAEHGDEKRMATAFGWYSTAREVGAALGFLIAGLLLTWTQDHYPTVFLFAVVTSVVALVLVAWLVRDSRSNADDVNTKVENNTDTSDSRTRWWDYAALGVMMALTGSMLTNLFPIIATEFAHLSKAETSVIYSLATLVIVFSAPVFGWLADHFSKGLVLSFRSVANAGSSIIYALFPSFGGFVAARLIDETGKAAFRPAWGALIADAARSTESHRRGKKIAYLDTAQSVGEALGPVLGGALWQWLNIYWLFGVRFALALVTEVFAVWVLRRRNADTHT